MNQGAWITGRIGGQRLKSIGSRLKTRREGGSPRVLSDLATVTELLRNNLHPLFPNAVEVHSDVSVCEGFDREVTEAVRMLSSASASIGDRLHSLVDAVVPLGYCADPKFFRVDGSGLSSHRVPGVILLSLPKLKWNRREELVINLAHELGHQSLMILQHADPIVDGDPLQPVYSAVRLAQRPAVLSFHAVSALMTMLEGVEELIRSDCSDLSLDYLKVRKFDICQALEAGIVALRTLRLTKLGLSILAEASDLLGWAGYPRWDCVAG